MATNYLHRCRCNVFHVPLLRGIQYREVLVAKKGEELSYHHILCTRDDRMLGTLLVFK